MPLWGNRQFPTQANTKPIHGFPHYFTGANVDPVSGRPLAVSPGPAGQNLANQLVGVTATGMTNTQGAAIATGTLYNRFGASGGPGHAGWVTIAQGRGFIRDVAGIVNAGNNVQNLSFALVLGGNGSGANLQVTGVNGNGNFGNVTSILLRSGGAGYNSSIVAVNNQTSAINVIFANSAGLGSNSNATVILGGRAGRTQFETIVAMGSLTGFDPVANVFFANNG